MKKNIKNFLMKKHGNCYTIKLSRIPSYLFYASSDKFTHELFRCLHKTYLHKTPLHNTLKIYNKLYLKMFNQKISLKQIHMTLSF